MVLHLNINNLLLIVSIGWCRKNYVGEISASLINTMSNNQELRPPVLCCVLVECRCQVGSGTTQPSQNLTCTPGSRSRSRSRIRIPNNTRSCDWDLLLRLPLRKTNCIIFYITLLSWEVLLKWCTFFWNFCWNREFLLCTTISNDC